MATKKESMTEIENLLECRGVRPTAVHILIYKCMAKKTAADLTDIEDAFEKARTHI